MQVGPIYLANAFYKDNKILIKEEAPIPKHSEVVLTYFNISKEPVNAKVSLPSSKNFPQNMVKKIEPGHKRKFIFIVTSDDCKLKNFLVEIVDLNKVPKKRGSEEIREKGKEKELEASSKKRRLENDATDENNCELTIDESTTDDEEVEVPAINLGLVIFDRTEDKQVPWEYIGKYSFKVTLTSNHEMDFYIQNPNQNKQKILCNLSLGCKNLEVNGKNIAILDYHQSIKLFTYTPKKEQDSILISYLACDWQALSGDPCFSINIPARIV